MNTKARENSNHGFKNRVKSENGLVRIAAVADIHCTRASAGKLAPILSQAAETADLLLLCGDLTDYGTLEEAGILLEVLKKPLCTSTIIGILGNHDFESGKADKLSKFLSDAGVIMLDGEAIEIFGVGITGIKGFAGGFSPHVLEAWGEEPIKAFVREAKNEAAKLEEGLARLKSTQRIVMLHYSPIRATVEREPSEIFPFLGSSHLEEPLNRYGVTAVFHGHAHHGHLEGRTSGNVPVFNVSMPVLKQLIPDRPPFRLIEVMAEAIPLRGS